MSDALRAVATQIRRSPRLAAAVAFGISTGTVTHFAWYAEARTGGKMLALTLAAGIAHALAGAITGGRLLDKARTRTPERAAWLGAVTSLLALGFFAPAMAAYVWTPYTPWSILNYAALTLYTGLFAFMAAGWALLIVSAGVAWGLFRLADAP